ncbi:MAG: 5'/3'-nucleotidase SurE [Myxococcota bacterium]
MTECIDAGASRSRSHRRRLTIAAALALAFAAVACASPGPRTGAAAPRGSLLVLLTNDDGYLSPGIRAVREALEAAGHDVVMVAPLENRSGAGSSTTTGGTLELREQGPKTWSVGGTPADSVRVGLDVVLRGRTPDLVVSGANFGQNVGPSTLASGTVGAALTAMQAGIPSIAVSVAIDPEEARAEPRFASTLAAFDDAAALVVRLVRRLDASRADDGSLLPPFASLNLNYPAREASAVAGLAWAAIGRSEGFRFGYERQEGAADTLRVVFRPTNDGESVARADTALLARGYATLTVLDGDLAAPDEVREPVRLRLEGIAP